MGWIAYGIAWLAATLFWTLASASSAGRSPLDTLPFGLLTMGLAAIMGLAVWRLGNRVAWDPRAASFYAVHGTALALFSVAYATSWVWPDLLTGRFATAPAALRASRVMIWNLLMGSWLYLVVAGLSYAVRGHRRVRAHEAAAAEARLLAQHAQLVALRAQINPHFLFNALHSVGALVTIEPARQGSGVPRRLAGATRLAPKMNCSSRTNGNSHRTIWRSSNCALVIDCGSTRKRTQQRCRFE